MVKFYNVKKRASVEINESNCFKKIYIRKMSNGTQERYAIRAKDDDGINLTKFINKQTFDSLSCKIEK